ncbi:MAG TPA: SpoIIE family protein phosphatase [Candidatus Acidoferrales bacterium]|nr:SpoIIE family protein phosphatase [Candidatus Acidoferrales bacterium]
MALAVDYRVGLAQTGAIVVSELADAFAVDALADEHSSPVRIFTIGVPVGDDDPLAFALVAAAGLVGTMYVWRHTPCNEEERLVLGEIATRIAVAISSAQLYERAAHVADTLQRALLPERLPSDTGIFFHAAYLPGAREAMVGGDFYDAFHLPDGRIAFAIGDVAGHGLHAAVVMGEVRQALRAAAIDPKSPSAVLERANTILNMRADPTMVTAIFGIIDPVDSSFTYATAGHPAPVVCMDGQAYVLPTRGVALGVTHAVDAQDWVFPLPPGAMLALYTDGMVEYDRDIVRGEEILRGLICKTAMPESNDPANELVHRLFHDRENTDDAAVLTISAAFSTKRSLSLTFSAIELALPATRNALRRYAFQVGLSADDTYALLTSVGEAMANSVLHAYEAGQIGLVRLALELDAAHLTAVIEDWGRWRRAPSREHGGRGLRIMRSLMDRVEIQSEQRHTLVRLVKAVTTNSEQP